MTTYTLDGMPVQMKPPDGTVTCFEYDTLKRRVKTVQDCREGGLNLTTRYAYDVLGNTVYVTDTRGIRTYYEYDALGRVILTRQDDGGLNLETQTTFDAAGNVSTTVGPDGTVTRYVYDAMNRLEQVCQDASGLNLCTSYTYDRRGRQETVTDANGVIQRTVYNAHGLPLQEIADADGLAATTSFEYDALLRLFQVTDANGNATHYTYTPRGSVESELYADGSTVHYTYDPRGNVATLTLADGAVITRTYDAANRQQQADFSTPSTGSGQGGGFQTFQYDSAGRLTQATQTLDGHTTVNRYGYSAVGDVVSTTQQLDGGSAWLTQYANDYLQGTRIITYPSGAARVYQMDSLNRLDTVETGASTLIAAYAYDVVNHFNTLAYANGLSNRVDYNALGWTTRVSSAVADYRYGYDNVGNRTYMQRYHQPGQPFDVYEYDGLYQLVNVWYGADAATPAEITSYDSAQSYDLDLLGNRLEVMEDGETEAYGPNDGTQLTNEMNQYESVNSVGLAYDLRGNTLDDGVNTYVYDVLNRQTGVSGPGGTAEYVYDARGRRVAKVTDGVTVTHYLYDTRYRVIEERDDDETLLARYTYGSGMDESLTMERGGETYYYHRDAPSTGSGQGLGSITEVTDDAGDLIERYEYDVYGAVTIFDGVGITLTASAIDNPYLFTARRYVFRCATDAAQTPRAATTPTAPGCTARGWGVSSVWIPSALSDALLWILT